MLGVAQPFWVLPPQHQCSPRFAQIPAAAAAIPPASCCLHCFLLLMAPLQPFWLFPPFLEAQSTRSGGS